MSPGRPVPAPAPAQVSVIGHRRYARLPARSTLVRWVRLAALSPVQIALLLTDARHARSLNRRYRGQDHATNVLTFAYQAQPVAIADVVICVPVARAEAKARGLSLREHLAHLVIHGVLHAQGLDHRHDAEARRMQALEVECLTRLRIADPYA